MLKSLKIKNIALIDEVKIDFTEGFNVLTGETGAGKSIIIDALNFVLGAKADKSLIRNGCEFAIVEGDFYIDTNNIELQNIFSSFNLELESLVKIYRYFSIDGKNECRLNGEVVTLNMLKKVTILLADVFGQHDNQILLDAKNHLNLLDTMCGKNLDILKSDLSVSLCELKKINAKIKELGGDNENREKELELLNFEIEQIESAKLSENEEDELTTKKTLYLNSEKIFNALKDCNDAIIYEQNIPNIVKTAINSLNSVKVFDDNLNGIIERLNSLKYELEDICDTLKIEQNSISYSEEELNIIEDRLEFIKSLKRKFGKTILDIFNYLENAKNKKNKLENCEFEIANLNKEKSEILMQTYEICKKITAERVKVADELKNKLIFELKELGIKNADFEVAFIREYKLSDIESKASSIGADDIEFLFSANLGEPVKSLSKIISGGEMSRFMLAFKCVVKTAESFKTFVFDEIDAGIGGSIGSAVAKKISKIAKNNQVLCITHLAQIASFGDTHFKITKYEDEKKTHTMIENLSSLDKIKEITRMIGTMDSDEFAILHAKELLKESENYKQKLA